MLSTFEIAQGVEMSAEVTEALEGFVESEDRRFEETLLNAGLDETSARKWRALSTVLPGCLSSLFLAKDLRAVGVEARPLINEEAYIRKEPIVSVADIATIRQHVIVGVDEGDQTYFIDSYWLQFFREYGISLEEITDNPDLMTLPTERILVYGAEELPLVQTWFATHVRWIQEKAARGVLMSKSDMFTRSLSVAEILLNDDVDRPTEYVPIAKLENVAQQIWSPDNYKVLSNEQVDSLLGDVETQASVN